ncbi:MAG TPA: hypothetical protein VFO95_13065, partial [Gemmatimonadales bacterium]|nr:hypothetical protein [Gemmatimonadales bacterium]
RGVVRMTRQEQRHPGGAKPMSSVLWDVFTGSAPYREVLARTLNPVFPLSLAWNVAAGSVSSVTRSGIGGERHER